MHCKYNYPTSCNNSAADAQLRDRSCFRTVPTPLHITTYSIIQDSSSASTSTGQHCSAGRSPTARAVTTRTMPRAAGELRLSQDRTPKVPDVHAMSRGGVLAVFQKPFQWWHRLTSRQSRRRSSFHAAPRTFVVVVLVEALNALSLRVHEAAARGSAVDTELCGVLTDLDISPVTPIDKVAMDAARIWATVEDEEDATRGSATG